MPHRNIFVVSTIAGGHALGATLVRVERITSVPMTISDGVCIRIVVARKIRINSSVHVMKRSKISALSFNILF